MVNYSYICGAEQHIIAIGSTRNIGGVPVRHIPIECVLFCKTKREHRFLCTY